MMVIRKRHKKERDRENSGDNTGNEKIKKDKSIKRPG